MCFYCNLRTCEVAGPSTDCFAVVGPTKIFVVSSFTLSALFSYLLSVHAATLDDTSGSIYGLCCLLQWQNIKRS